MDRDVIRKNRQYLSAITRWISDEDYANSRGYYGCPPRIYPLLNLPINDEPTYTDLIVCAAQRLHHPIRYLELGVSVGKNFYVIANALENASLCGFDWERINPTLERQFQFRAQEGPIRYYCHRSNAIAYLQGDIFEKANWALLRGSKFNLIFSDASHHEAALLHEFEMLRKFELIDERGFMMIWDDLDGREDGPMTGTFRHICKQMQRRYGLERDGMFRVALNGWLGQHEHRHTVGVINTIGLIRDVLQIG